MTGPARRERSAEEVARDFAAGDVRALARAFSWVDDGDPRGAEVLASAFSRTGRARVIGVTGAPGAGKSTLVDRLACVLAEAGRRVAIVAVDPSSPFTGGAILGDRIRMGEASRAPGVFIRSMATRGHLGGLGRSTDDGVDLMDAFGFDDVIIETVGVGQDEIEVVKVAAVNLVVLVPFMGDDVQTIKAGLMEIADAFVINKADRDGADRLEAHLTALVQLEDPPRDIPILRTVATRGEGVGDLVGVAEQLLAAGSAEEAAERRRQRIEQRVTSALRERLLSELLDRPGIRDELDRAVARVLGRTEDPHAAVDAILGRAKRSGVRLDHVGVAVESAEEALAFWRDAVGLPLAHVEEVASERVKVAMLPAGDSQVELLEPLDDSSTVRSFLDKRGGGIHHACLAVDDIEAALERLRAAGAQVIGEAPRPGAEGKLVAFIHPRSANGVLLELSQEPSP